MVCQVGCQGKVGGEPRGHNKGGIMGNKEKGGGGWGSGESSLGRWGGGRHHCPEGIG